MGYGGKLVTMLKGNFTTMEPTLRRRHAPS